MQNCGNCGAALAPGAQWCGQCYAPVQRQPMVAPQPGQPPLPPPPPVQGQTPLGQPIPGRRIVESEIHRGGLVGQPPVYSRWRGGPDSFGPTGRILLTLLLGVAVFLGYFLGQGAMVLTVGQTIPPVASAVMYSIIAVPLSIWALARIWKRARVG